MYAFAALIRGRSASLSGQHAHWDQTSLRLRDTGDIVSMILELRCIFLGSKKRAEPGEDSAGCAP
jgi:hypothetical protein